MSRRNFIRGIGLFGAIAAGALIGVDVRQSILMAGIMGIATTFQYMARSYIDDGKMTSVELNVLTACQDALQEKQKLISLLAKTFHLEPQDVFYHWLTGKLPQPGHLSNNKQWKYFFHGLECDFQSFHSC